MKKRHPLRLSLEVLTLLLVVATLYQSYETRRAAGQAREDATQKLRVDTWLEMEKRYDAKEMDKSTAKLATQLDPYNPTNRDVMDTRMIELFDDIGTLYKKDMIDTDLVESSFSYDVNHWWVASQPFIQDLRKSEGNDPTLYNGFEYLAKVLADKDQKITEQDIKAFLAEEKHTYE